MLPVHFMQIYLFPVAFQLKLTVGICCPKYVASNVRVISIPSISYLFCRLLKNINSVEFL